MKIEVKTAEDILFDSNMFPDSNVLIAMARYANQFKTEWVNIEKRLPEKQGSYLVTFKNIASIRISSYVFHDGKWDWIHDHDWFNISHWMPLPALPE